MDEHTPQPEYNTPDADEDMQTKIAVAQVVLRFYRRKLAKSLNRNVDRLEPLFLAAEAAKKDAAIQCLSVRRKGLHANAMARHSEWLLARWQGRHKSVAVTRREKVGWELAYRWQEFLIYLRCHWPLRRHEITG